jgi:hypothetical protein
MRTGGAVRTHLQGAVQQRERRALLRPGVVANSSGVRGSSLGSCGAQQGRARRCRRRPAAAGVA